MTDAARSARLLAQDVDRHANAKLDEPSDALEFDGWAWSVAAEFPFEYENLGPEDAEAVLAPKVEAFGAVGNLPFTSFCTEGEPATGDVRSRAAGPSRVPSKTPPPARRLLAHRT